MKFTLETSPANTIRSFSGDCLTIGNENYMASIILGPDFIVSDWQHPDLSDFDEAVLEPALAHDPEVLVIGSGHRHRFPAAALMGSMAERGIGLEVMDTAAACRTYNVLVQEDRRVVAALLID